MINRRQLLSLIPGSLSLPFLPNLLKANIDDGIELRMVTKGLSDRYSIKLAASAIKSMNCPQQLRDVGELKEVKIQFENSYFLDLNNNPYILFPIEVRTKLIFYPKITNQIGHLYNENERLTKPIRLIFRTLKDKSRGIWLSRNHLHQVYFDNLITYEFNNYNKCMFHNKGKFAQCFDKDLSQKIYQILKG